MRKLLPHVTLLLLLLPVLWAQPARCEDNQVLGTIEFQAHSDAAKTSGVWVDGQYVGYLGELNGSKKVLLLPGEHTVAVRQDGYQEFRRHVALHPGHTTVVRVEMKKAATAPFPHNPATLKINVNPSRAAVFMDGLFVGHVGEFKGAGRGMLVPPGEHQIKIALPGYQTFVTKIDLLASQQLEIKTDLVHNNAPLSGPLVLEHGTRPGASPDAMASPSR